MTSSVRTENRLGIAPEASATTAQAAAILKHGNSTAGERGIRPHTKKVIAAVEPTVVTLAQSRSIALCRSMPASVPRPPNGTTIDCMTPSDRRADCLRLLAEIDLGLAEFEDLALQPVGTV